MQNSLLHGVWTEMCVSSVYTTTLVIKIPINHKQCLPTTCVQNAGLVLLLVTYSVVNEDVSLQEFRYVYVLHDSAYTKDLSHGKVGWEQRLISI